MTRRLRPFANPFSIWLDVATKSVEMCCASSEVIAKRTQRMATMGSAPSRSDQREMKRMVDEKTDAASESLRAMGLSTSAACQRAMLGGMQQMMRNTTSMMWSGKPRRMNVQPNLSQIATATAAVAKAGLLPYHRRATNNARRLRKGS